MQNGPFKLSVNLKQKPEEGVTNAFLKWAVNSGRIIIVVVELLTLSALGFRFYIDSRIIDLHDKIINDQKFVNALSKKEVLYRSLQNRLTLVNTLNTQNNEKIDFLNQLVTILNSDRFIETTLTFSETSIGINGTTYSVFDLNSLIDNLKGNPNVLSISIDSISSGEQGIDFHLTTALKQNAALP
ncbi:MAG: PilN domain-containing protein [Candidatus Levyibacteriota bacterium]